MSRRGNSLDEWCVVRGLWLVLCLAVALTFVSCNRKIVYSHYVSTPMSGWDKADTLTFIVSPIPASGLYQETVGVRINGSYPFLGLTLIVEQERYPAGGLSVDTLHATIMDENGMAQGKGVSLLQYTFPLRSVHLSEGDSLTVRIRHFMLQDRLPGISDVGLALAPDTSL